MFLWSTLLATWNMILDNVVIENAIELAFEDIFSEF